MTDQGQEQTPASAGNLMGLILALQLGLSVVIAALFWGFEGRISAYSALLGGLTCLLPNAFLALRLAVPRRDSGASSLIQAAYIGEIGKLALTVLMFTLVFTLVRPLAPGALFAGFIAVQLVTFAGFFVRDKSQETVKRLNNGE